jgi:dihydrofolate synthase/folylpolyglutamate synthase
MSQPGNISEPAAAQRSVASSSAAASPARQPRQFASEQAAIAYLRSLPSVESLRPSAVDSERTFDLRRMRALCAALGNPQDSFTSVHVAGSKGKGSVCEMTTSALRACGCTVGLYTSPHMIDLRERIRLDGAMIPPESFAAVLSTVATAADSIAPQDLGEVTYFEALTAAAFVYFAEQAVDIAVIEVGLGGRGDATNVITPAVSAIASIQLEHREILGDTLEKIAREKAGIFKPGVPAISVPQKEGVEQVFRDVAGNVGTTVDFLAKEIEFSARFETSSELGSHQRVVLTTKRSNFEHIPVPLKGEHQGTNLGLALAILDKLRSAGFQLPDGKIAEGIAKTPNHGRLEQVFDSPRILVDGAHNPESIAALTKAVGSQIRGDSLVVVFGCAADKEIVRMLTSLAHGADKVIFTKAENNTRAADPRDLARKFMDLGGGKMAQIAPTVKDAINLAARAVSQGDLIVVTGSFAVAGEAKRLLLERRRAASVEPKPGFASARIQSQAAKPAPGNARKGR